MAGALRAAAAVGLVAVVAWLAAVMPWRLAAGIVLLGPGGRAAEARTRGPARDARARPVAPRDERRARELLARLAVLGGVRSPRLVCEPGRVALSWTTAVPWRPATIHVPSGLLRRAARAPRSASSTGHEAAASPMTLRSTDSWRSRQPSIVITPDTAMHARSVGCSSRLPSWFDPPILGVVA
jgi:hypothetical protein